MRLVSCHIENFGRLSHFDASFEDGVHVIREDNGWGKSTFAAFICAMFYGFDGERKRNLEENERKRYKPWQGGVYGGSLTFTWQGRTYIATRTFGEKDAQDEFELRDAETNLVSADFSAALGEELFGIDRASFTRTAFIGQQGCPVDVVTGAINAKIGNLTDVTGDMDCFESANKVLQDMINSMSPRRATGSIAKRRDEIAACMRTDQTGETLISSMDEYGRLIDTQQARRTELKQKLGEVHALQEKISIQKQRMSDRREWDRLKSVAVECRDVMTKRRAFFSEEVPENSDVKQQLSECNRLQGADERLKLCTLSYEEEEELSRLKADSEAMKDISQSDFETMSGRWSARCMAAASLPSRQSTASMLRMSLEKAAQEASSHKPVLAVIGAVAALIGILAALGLFGGRGAGTQGAFGESGAGAGQGTFGGIAVLGVIAAVIGVILICVDRIICHNRQKNRQEANSPELEAMVEAIRRDESEIEKTDADVRAFFAGLGIGFDEGTVSERLRGLEQEYVRREDRLKLLSGKQAQATAARGERDRIVDGISAYLRRYGFTPAEQLRTQLEEILDRLAGYCDAVRCMKNAEQELERFGRSVDTQALADVDMTEEPASLEELNAQARTIGEELEQIQRTTEGYRNNLRELQEKYEAWENNHARLEVLKEQQATEERKHRLLEVTRKHLTAAKEAMTARYSEPLRKSFAEYYGLLSGLDASGFHVDANTTLTFDEQGRQRETVSLSAGLKDLTGIALRLALVDAMYSQERPVLVMDDPFTNLDDSKLALGRGFLEEVAKKYQIVYLTCSTSRL